MFCKLNLSGFAVTKWFGKHSTVKFTVKLGELGELGSCKFNFPLYVGSFTLIFSGQSLKFQIKSVQFLKEDSVRCFKFKSDPFFRIMPK